MRIGLLTGEYPPDQGGVGDFTRELAHAMAALGHRPHVLTDHDRPVSGEPQREGVTVHRAIDRWDWGCWGQVERVGETFELDALNIQYQAAAYHMHPAVNLLPWHLRNWEQAPVVVTFHDLRVPYLFPKAGPLRWQAVLALAHWADGVIVTNPEDELRLAESQLSTPVVRIPIGSNIAPQLPAGYVRDAWRLRWRFGTGDLVLGYFGFLNERKGGETLIETLAALVARGVSAHLLLIGGRVGTSDPTNAAYADRVDRLIAEHDLGARVHRTGFVSRQEVSACLEAVDVFVLPYREGASMRHGSLHACLAHGRPIVTTRPAVRTPEFRDEENMVLVPPGDGEALAEEALRLWRDDALRERVGRGAALLSREFTWDRIAARTVDFFEALRV
jgi:glycosyltransferase involved in cell wall biosynthesis